MSPRPLAIDLFCGLGGWTEGFLAEGWRVVGFDIEQHVYGEHRYPAQLVLQDVRTLHGSQFKDADMIVASSPCQEFSYRAMPWKRAKALGPPELGMELFAQAARIQAEAIAAAGGRFIPMIQENVKGAQKYVGRAPWHYGSYYLWGDVPALMPVVLRAQKHNPDGTTHGVGSWFAVADSKNRGASAAKNTGGSWFNIGSPGQKVLNNNPTRREGEKLGDRNAHRSARFTNPDEQPTPGVKQHGSGAEWFDKGIARHGSKSNARKAASVRIAKIPLPLASHIARTFYPHRAVETPDGAA